MNTPLNEPSRFSGDSHSVMSEATDATRPLYWSVRRELWENRSIVIAPIMVTAVVMFASLIRVFGLAGRIKAVPAGDAAKLHAVVVGPFSFAPAPILFATFLVGMYYLLDSLYGERRDRSILFWKSMPVSDLTVVLSKVSVPLVLLPLLGCVLSLVVQFILLMFGTMVLPGGGVSPVTLWREFRFFQELVVMFYGVGVHVLWYAPIYGWLLLVSAWARRTPFLWAVLPPFALYAVERIAFSSSHFGAFMKYRWGGAMERAFVVTGKDAVPVLDRIAQLSPAKFVSTPGLWIGLAFAAACFATAVRLRRDREPI